ncbi:MAG: hypothetical protein FJW20_21825 [Acidimicrobiia bacterium]|nr:hypothetical protein [Acidimicrobiia bacterium]
MKRKMAIAVLAIMIAGIPVAWKWGDRIEFMLGGALINAGYRLQDPLISYDFEHENVTPAQVWDAFLDQNRLASSIRARWPRSPRHPVIAMIICMDGRLDSNEIAGDTRRYYYVLRLAGSVLAPKEEEMLELAVDNGVKVVVFTTHSDCAAEKAAADPAKRAKYPELSRALDERKMRFEEFLGRHPVKSRISSGRLIVKWMDLNTATERVEEHRDSN